jgi:tRNA threonylcarbamoyladenosine biosynthesis protein TsaE
MEFLSKSLIETKKIADNFLSGLKKGDMATVVALSGELGSGKTAFVKCVAKTLGVHEDITSPTFVIQKRYELKDRQFFNLIHIDAYRLNSFKELESLRWQEILDNDNNLVFVEWPERVAEIIPNNARKINFEFIDESTRKINILN